MYSKYSTLLFATALLLPFMAAATPLSYNYVDVNYFNVEVDGTQIDENGFAAGVSAEFAQNFYFIGRYADTDPIERVSAGVGAKGALAPATSIYGVLSFEHVNANPADGNGLGLETGLRQAVTENFELNGAVQYFKVDDVAVFNDEFGYKLGGLYNLSDNFGIEAGYSIVDDYEEFTVGGRMNF